MEKEIYRRHLTRGCVWVFMSMFDFKHGGGSNQKLLMDKKHGSKRIIGIETKDEMQSVKNLIEEEIYDKEKARNQKKRRSSGTWSKTSEDINVLDAINDDETEKRKSDYDSEEKFSELIKRLIAQKESEIEIKSCKKNLVDAFQECDSNEEESRNSQCTQTIVILKPEVNNDSDKVKNGGFGSRFLLSRIRRRLKSVVEKTPCNITQQDSDQDQDALSQNNSIASKGEASEEEIIINGGEDDSKKSMCGIYITAKKHLSEMLAEGGDIEVDSSEKEAPRILGKILALPEFSTPENSPRITSAQDYCSEPLTLDSNKDEVPIGVSETVEKEEEEKIVLDSLSESIVDEDDEHKQPLEKETFDEEKHSLSSPPRMSEQCQENVTDVPGKSSPVSVLEPFFTDDELSPNSSKFSSVENRMKPLCIRFDEPDSPKPRENNVDGKELTLEYIQAVVKSSELNWEEILARSFYSDQLLEQALMEDIDFCSNNFCDDKKLLFDCINEVLTEFCEHGPWISFVKPAVMENAVEVVQEEVYWHLLPLPSPHTLDQIVKKDLARSGRWMDLRFDIGFIGFEISEVIIDELVEEIIKNSNFVD